MTHDISLTQPGAMRSEEYIYGVEPLNGFDAWSLFVACARGDLSQAQSLLARDPRLVNAQYWYRFPLHMAVWGGHTKLVQLLLKHGADPGQSIYTYDSWNKLLQAAQDRGHQQIASLLEKAMQKKFNYAPQFSLLRDAILAGNGRQVNSVIRRHPELVEASDSLGNNALHWSVLARQISLIDRFVELGTPLEARRADGQTPILLAVNGATDYWYRDTRSRSHPALRNHFVLVGVLLAHGADYSMSVAAAVGDQERVEQLLKRDTSLAKRLDSARISPLSYAARSGYLHIVELLLKNGADPNAPEDAAPGGRALFEACCGNHFEVAKRLLQQGADPNTGTDSSECCLTITGVYHGERAKPLELLLLQYGAQRPAYRMSLAELKEALDHPLPAVVADELLDVVLNQGNLKLLDRFLASPHWDPRDMQFGGGGAHLKSPAMARKLIAGGLDPNQTDWLGRTYLHACAEHGTQAVATVLLAAGADIDARDLEFQGTPLTAAVRAWCQETDPDAAQRLRHFTSYLHQRGARLNRPGEQPWSTPQAWAQRFSRPDILAHLQLLQDPN